MKRKKSNKDIEIIKKNTRMPTSVLGDINSQISACRTGEKAFKELLKIHGNIKFRLICEEIHNYAERIIRSSRFKAP